MIFANEWKGLFMEYGKQKNFQLSKIRALAVRGEEGGGSEIVQTVIVLGFAVGLGAALMLLQGSIQSTITTAGTNIADMFSKVSSGAAK